MASRDAKSQPHRREEQRFTNVGVVEAAALAGEAQVGKGIALVGLRLRRKREAARVQRSEDGARVERPGWSPLGFPVARDEGLEAECSAKHDDEGGGERRHPRRAPSVELASAAQNSVWTADTTS